MGKRTMEEFYAQLGSGLSLHDELSNPSKPEDEIKPARECKAEPQVEQQQSELEGKPPVSEDAESAGGEVSEITDGDDHA